MDIETIMRRVSELKLTTHVNMAFTGSRWEASMKTDEGTYKTGVGATMDEAFRDAVRPRYGQSLEEWLEDDDDWKGLV